MKTPLPTPFLGAWSITEMGAWDETYIHEDDQGHFTFKKNGSGNFQFGLVRGDMDCRVERVNGADRVEFSWEGQDELDRACGRGWAIIEDGALQGRIFFHLGEESSFVARKKSNSLHRKT